MWQRQICFFKLKSKLLTTTSLICFNFCNGFFEDKQLPKRSAVRSVSQLLRAGKNTVHCPVYNRSITRPTIYYSIRRDFIRSSTEILVSRFSDGSVLLQDSTFDIQRDANYSLVIRKPETAPAELLIWCHVSSDVDGVNLMSGFVNVTREYCLPLA